MKADLYDCVRTGPGRGDWRLKLREPLRMETRDNRGPRFPLFGPNDVVRLATRSERGTTRDETLTPMTSGQTISLGTRWDGTGVNSKLDEKVGPIRDFVRGFIPDNVVGAEDPGTVIRLGRVYLPRVEGEETREALTRALDEAEEEWRKDRRSQGQGVEGTSPPTTDSATRRTLFGAARTRDYAASLRRGREAQSVTAPGKVRTAGDYAANLAAGRAAKNST